MLERDVNFQSLSKLADANINRACLIGDDTEIRATRWERKSKTMQIYDKKKKEERFGRREEIPSYLPTRQWGK